MSYGRRTGETPSRVWLDEMQGDAVQTEADIAERQALAEKAAALIEANAEEAMKTTVRRALAAGKGRREAIRAGTRAMDKARRDGIRAALR